MADAAANLPEATKTLCALLRALRTCLVRPRERAEKIACLDLDNYRGAAAIQMKMKVLRRLLSTMMSTTQRRSWSGVP